MKYTIKFTKIALEDLEKHKRAGYLKVLKKIEILLNELMVNPFSGTGKPEILRHDLKG